MTLYSQTDKRWKSDKMGKTNNNVGGFGCLMSDVGMVVGKNPGETNKLFNGAGVYNAAGLVLWDRIHQVLPLQFIARVREYDNSKVLDAIKNYGFCLVEVDFDGKPETQRDTHWVIFIGNKRMINPLGGVEQPNSKYPVLKGYAVLKKI